MKAVVLLLILTLNILWVSLAPAAEKSVVINSTEDVFDDIRDNVRDAIIGRGMKISNEVHASEMLNRTAPDLGIGTNVYIHAESIEFCNAMLSHKMVAANPSNMVLCPFLISIYVLTESPNIVYVAYETPTVGEESVEVLKEVAALLQEIVTEALE